MKFMNMKRFASTAMAGVMALSLATPAFATGTTIITGTYQDIEIAVEVPDTGTAQINPYGLPIEISKSDKTTVTIADQQITTQPLSIKNQGTTPLDVNASLHVTPKGEVEIKAAKDADKGIKVSLEVVGLNDADLALSSSDKSLDDLLIDKFVADSTWASPQTLAAPAATASTAATVDPAKSASAMATLGAATVEGKTITYGPKSIALVRLSGELAEAPKTGTTDNPWETTDGFEANVVFSFKPAAKTAIAVAGTGATGVGTAKGYEGDTVVVTFTGAAGKTCTGVVSGMKAGTTAPTVTIAETSTAGTYTATFVMPEDDATAGITLTISGLA